MINEGTRNGSHYSPDLAIRLTTGNGQFLSTSEDAIGDLGSMSIDENLRSKMSDKSRLRHPMKPLLSFLHPNNTSSGFSSHLLKRLPKALV